MSGPIPIVGAPAVVLTWYPTAIVRCLCQPEMEKQSLVILVGFNTPGLCPQCQKQHLVVGVQGPEITVQTLLPVQH